MLKKFEYNNNFSWFHIFDINKIFKLILNFENIFFYLKIIILYNFI